MRCGGERGGRSSVRGAVVGKKRCVCAVHCCQRLLLRRTSVSVASFSSFEKYIAGNTYSRAKRPIDMHRSFCPRKRMSIPGSAAISSMLAMQSAVSTYCDEGGVNATGAGRRPCGHAWAGGPAGLGAGVGSTAGPLAANVDWREERRRHGCVMRRSCSATITLSFALPT